MASAILETSGTSCSDLDVGEELPYLPERLKTRLLPFQKKGIVFALKRSGRCMIADETVYMGLGKTIQAIAVSYYYRNEWPLLIVVPSSLRRIPTSKVIVLGYGLLTSDAQTLIDTLYKQKFRVVIVDESHYMKSRNSARSKILLPIVQNAVRAILLTGTPALGRPEEVLFFGKKQQWDCRGASNLDELHQLLSNVMIRRLKNDVLTQLPPKIRQRIPFDLPKTAATEFNASFEEWEKLMRASHLDSTESDFVQVMGLITRMFKQTAIAKTRYIRIDGSVASAERINLVNQFQKDPDTRVAILSIQAAGQGLTFTAATHVVFAELYWDPGHIKQAEDRAHRIGQCSSVNIHYLIANGTMDPLMWAMLNRKAKVTGTTLNGKKEKLQAQEGDREKWNFLNFAEAWAPNESLNETKNEVLFTHFEKEKQHDIRTFLSPKPNPERKRKKGSCDNSPQEEKSTESGNSLDSEELNELDIPCKEAKRPRASEPCTPKSSSKEGRKSLFQESDYSFTKQITEEDFGTPLSHSSKDSVPEAIWHCSLCTYSNNSLLPYCEMCESPRRRNIYKEDLTVITVVLESTVIQSETQISSVSVQSEKENIAQDIISQNGIEETNNASQTRNLGLSHLEDSGSFPAYSGLMFCASRNTDRIHVYTKDNEDRLLNYVIPFLYQILYYWFPFINCLFFGKARAFEYVTKEDITKASVAKADIIGGSVRMVTKKSVFALKNPIISAEEKEKHSTKLASNENCPDSGQSDNVEELPLSKGYVQAVDNEGNPLCLSCQKPAVQVDQAPASTAWDTRFCSHKCQDDFLFRTSQSYLRSKVFEIEHGICQLCNLNAQELYLCVRDAPKNKRKKNSKASQGKKPNEETEYSFKIWI
ncbi:hypothetical protein JD844_022546 [Phrynosoma platyrhinos]|uniref:DNA annealing helicase and endonuclease ZRANB3 n=1 Tax=Phrynosoma platyrhinos TaxID=52577 RepID=A0ABQ7SVR1_PHRPL|nr:hypothetical protein JD844_022546 [Phrynosoma platyrhinos]